MTSCRRRHGQRRLQTLAASAVLHSLLLPLLVLVIGSVAALDFKYHSNQELYNFLLNVSQAYPTITKLHSIGRSVRGTELWVLVVGQSVKSPVLLRPNVKYVGNIHGNEVVGRELLLHFTEHLVTGYGHDYNVTRLLNTTTVHILPTINPDGFQAADPKDCIGVKGRNNANGADLNRNFPDFFQENRVQRQAETRAVMSWINDTHFVLSANLHGGTVVANYPFDSYVGTMIWSQQSLSPDDDVFQHLARTYSVHHATMSHHEPCDHEDQPFHDGITNGAQWYPLIGGMQDYNYVRAGCYELTLELSCCKYPPSSELPKFWEDNRHSMLIYLQQVHMGVKGLVLDVNNNPVSNAIVTVEGREQVPFRTSHLGEYFKLLLPGAYTLMVSEAGRGVVTAPFHVVSGTVTRLDLALSDGAGKGGNIAASPAASPPSPSAVLLVVLLSLELTLSRTLF